MSLLPEILVLLRQQTTYLDPQPSDGAWDAAWDWWLSEHGVPRTDYEVNMLGNLAQAFERYGHS